MTEATLVPQAVVQALGVAEMMVRSPEEALDSLLRETEAILLLDNCEHLVEACTTLVARLLLFSIVLSCFVWAVSFP